MRKPRQIKDRSPRRLIGRLRKKASPYRRYVVRGGIIFLVAFISYSFLGGEFGFLNLMRMQRHRNQLRVEKRQLIAEIVDLETRLKRIKSDSEYVEKLAREKYGLAKKGEVIIRIPEKPSYTPE
ncbi:MAG: septum formation initiator family protein [Candidatus Zixiibacteriota bacterium]